MPQIRPPSPMLGHAYIGARAAFRPLVRSCLARRIGHISTGVIAVTDPSTPILPVVSPSNLFPGPDAPVSARLSTTQNAFSMEAGGGLDYRISKYFSVRPVEVDYVLTRFPSLSSGTRENQSHIKASA